MGLATTAIIYKSGLVWAEKKACSHSSNIQVSVFVWVGREKRRKNRIGGEKKRCCEIVLWKFFLIYFTKPSTIVEFSPFLSPRKSLEMLSIQRVGMHGHAKWKLLDHFLWTDWIPLRIIIISAIKTSQNLSKQTSLSSPKRFAFVTTAFSVILSWEV